MTDPIKVAEPKPEEELRQLAETVADLHGVISIIVENAKQLVPGEAVDELSQAWKVSEKSMKALAEDQRNHKVLFTKAS